MINIDSKRNNFIKNLDWISILLYLSLLFIGWINIYATCYDDNNGSSFDFSLKYGKQIIWIGAALIIAFLILLTDSKFFTAFSLYIYLTMMLILLYVAFFGSTVHGAKAWINIGSFMKIQPAEFAKFATCLAVANIMSKRGFKIMRLKDLIKVGIIVLLPILFILLQNDTGSALVYFSFIFAMYREGLHGVIPILIILSIIIFILALLYTPLTVLIIILFLSLFAYLIYNPINKTLLKGISIIIVSFLIFWTIFFIADIELSSYIILLMSFAILSIVCIFYSYSRKRTNLLLIIVATWLTIGASSGVTSIFNKLQPHQKVRINNLLGITEDKAGTEYQVLQSQIAIGSGGFTGKGFLQGTQTKLNFVPEQSTDFIFSSVGEEWGFIGCFVVLSLLLGLIARMVFLAERQRSVFSRIYGYGVVGILFFHIAINIGITIGIMPVIGIPLPFLSYGGSSLWSFTILIFIFLKLDSNRLQIFR